MRNTRWRFFNSLSFQKVETRVFLYVTHFLALVDVHFDGVKGIVNDVESLAGF